MLPVSFLSAALPMTTLLAFQNVESPDSFARFSQAITPQFVGLVGLVGGLTVAVVAIVVGCWTAVRTREIDRDLKLSLLEKGLSPEEIERIVSAGEKK